MQNSGPENRIRMSFFRFSGPDSGGDRAAVRGREAFSGSGRRLRSVPSGPAAVQFPTPFSFLRRSDRDVPGDFPCRAFGNKETFSYLCLRKIPIPIFIWQIYVT